MDFTATPEEMAVLIEVRPGDTVMLMEIVDRIGLLSPAEQEVWELDQRINERGVHLDVPLIDAAIDAGAGGQARALRRDRGR